MVKLVCLHGFWGGPEEFDEVLTPWPADLVWKPDLFQKGDLDPTHSFTEWTHSFLQELKNRTSEPVVLIGYSQGGRLALHAALQAPEAFRHVVFLSTHPGQLSSSEAAARQRWIDDWCHRFLNKDWEHLIREWNAQAIFVGTGLPPSKRLVERELLAQALTNWSLLRHTFDWRQLQQLSPSSTWVFGALDQKFLGVKDSLERHTVPGEKVVVANAGHRLMREAPKAITKLLQTLCKE